MLGGRPADLDQTGGEEAFRLISACIGPRQYAWIGAIDGHAAKDGCMAAQSDAGMGRGQLGRPQPCNVFLPVLCQS